MVGEPLASVLRSGRDVFNTKYTQARRRFPNLEAAAFSEFIESVLAPVAQTLPLRGEELASWTQAAYDAGLELVGEGAFSAEAKGESLVRAWTAILPQLSAKLHSPPEVAIAAISNAVHNLSRARGARVDDWIQQMAQGASSCESLEDFLKFGQVLAWRAGMAQMREGSLALLATMSEPLIVRALDLREGVSVKTAFKRLASDLWFDPSKPPRNNPTGLRAVRRVGGFRGFGGEFITPPTVASLDQNLFVASGEDFWLLSADVFGSSFHRATRAEYLEAARSSSRQQVARITSRTLVVDATELSLDLPGAISSVAVLPHTIAVTSTHTHAIQLLAR